MSFAKTTKNIDRIINEEKPGTVPLERVFDMMVGVAYDVIDFNKGVNLAETPADDIELLLESLCSIIPVFTFVYERYREAFEKQSEEDSNELKSMTEELNKILLELMERKSFLKQNKEKANDIKEKYNELQETRGHLLSVKEECEELQRQIDVLSDPVLDKIAREKELLEKDFLERKKITESLNKEKEKIQNDLDKVAEDIRTLKNTILRLQEEEESISNEENELLKEKNGMERALENLRAKVKEYENWTKSNSEMSNKIKQNIQEEEAKFVIMQNAVNSTITEDFLRETLFKTNSATEELTIEEHPDYQIAKPNIVKIDDLELWFNNLGCRINGLIEIYGTMLRTLVLQSEKMTKEAKESNS